MFDIVTQSELLNISNSIEDNAKIYKDGNQILDEVICKQYDVIRIKEKLKKLFEDFKSAKYLYDFPLEERIKISADYEYKVGSSQRSNASKVENAVLRETDKLIYTTDVYNSIINLSYKLTGYEAIYLINTFLRHKSEEEIATIIEMSKTYLQKIKKSCIVKMWINLKQYCDEDD